MKLREMNEYGIDRLMEYINSSYTGTAGPPPFNLLEDNQFTHLCIEDIEIERREFRDKREMAGYLKETLATLPLEKIQFNKGLWTWLSLFFFDQICPEEGGQRKVLKYWHYGLDVVPGRPNWKTYYRHLIASPYYIYCFYPDSAHLILDQPVNVHGDYMEQLASRQEMISCRAFIEAADKLYFDFENKKPRRGVQARNKPGNLRRFTQPIFQQFNLTYDLHSMNVDQVIDLLPETEFNHWLEI